MEDFFSLLFYQTQGSWEPLHGWETSKEYKTRAYNHNTIAENQDCCQ